MAPIQGVLDVAGCIQNKQQTRRVGNEERVETRAVKGWYIQLSWDLRSAVEIACHYFVMQ